MGTHFDDFGSLLGSVLETILGTFGIPFLHRFVGPVWHPKSGGNLTVVGPWWGRRGAVVGPWWGRGETLPPLSPLTLPPDPDSKRYDPHIHVGN